MIISLSILIFLITLAFLIRDAGTYKPERLALSPFWYFTFLFLIAFPVRAYLIDAQLVVIQALPLTPLGQAYSKKLLALALVFGTLLWLIVLLGRKHTLSQQNPTLKISQTSLPPQFRMLIGLCAIAIAAAFSISLLGTKTLGDFGGSKYQMSRMGSGLLWVMPELFLYAVLTFIGWCISQRKNGWRWIEYLLLMIIVAFVVWISNALFTRRLLAAVLLAIVTLIVMRHHRLWYLALAGIFSTVLAAPILNFIRHLSLLNEKLTLQSWQDLWTDLFTYNLFTRLSGAFEGVGHVARLMEKTTSVQLWTGIDHGLSWAFNAGLALLPRTFWAGKPLIYGGIEQFHNLYPDSFKGEFAEVAVPMSFAVDFSYGFGLPFALVMAYVFGRLLGATERTLWDKASHSAQIALCLFIFIFMFNWVRGGTIIVQSVILFSIPAALMLGLRPVLHAVFGLAGEAVGLVGGRWWGSQRIYFYPHAYLRDRQLDTIRGWAKDKAVNVDIAAQRTGAQVERNQTLAPARSSWKTVLPLINLKRRPKDAPEDAAIYVWGGLISKGPFITDIDNPYAFTAYNTLAVKLYRPIIQSFLESPRCLEIRCLSQACLDGVRREYGEVAAAKAIVAYPKIPAKVTQPHIHSTKTCRFLFVSTQFDIKGGAALLNAFKKVVREFPGAELDMVTHLPDGIDVNISNVRVHPAHLTRDEISAQFLSNADVLVHPTYFDSFGMVVLEALAHGLPVIATDVYAIKEMVEDQNNGLILEAPLSIWSGTRPTHLFSDTTKVRDLVRVTDTSKFEDALTEAMLKMARDTEFRTQASAASLHLVRTKFSGTP